MEGKVDALPVGGIMPSCLQYRQFGFMLRGTSS